MADEPMDPKDLAREGETFCACGRRRSECDGSRAGCSQVDAMLADLPFASTELARLRAELDAAISDHHGAFGDEVEPASERLEQARKAWAAAGGKCVLGHPGCDTSHSCAHNTRTDGPCEDCAAETETENAELRAQVERLTRERDEARTEADRRTREVEGTFRVQTELRARADAAEAELERVWAALPACDPDDESSPAERVRSLAGWAGRMHAEAAGLHARANAAETKVAGLAAALSFASEALRPYENDGHDGDEEDGHAPDCRTCAVEAARAMAEAALANAAPILAAHVEAAVAPVRAERDALAAALVCGATPYEDAPTHRCVYCDDEVTW